MPARADSLMLGDKSSKGIKSRNTSRTSDRSAVLEVGRGAGPSTPRGRCPCDPNPQAGAVRLSGSRLCPSAPRRLPLAAAWLHLRRTIPQMWKVESGIRFHECKNQALRKAKRGPSSAPASTARRYYFHPKNQGREGDASAPQQSRRRRPCSVDPIANRPRHGRLRLPLTGGCSPPVPRAPAPRKRKL